MSSKKTQTRRASPPPARRFPIALALAGVGLVIIALAAFFSRQASPAAAPEVTGRPNIRIDQALIDHGEVKLGTPITDVVRVTNTGDQTLRFTEAPYIEVLEGC